MITYKQLLHQYIDELKFLYDLDEATSLFHLALEHISSKKAISFKLNADQLLNEALASQLSAVLTELQSGRPIQYILGETEFYGIRLQLSNDVLIPRTETEELVDLIIKNHQQSTGLQLIDIGTGSGCIPIALAKNLSYSTITAIDVSAAAIKVAKLNAEMNKVVINFRELDILEWDVIFDKEKFDVIVSNPPYIRELEKAEMHPNVLMHEPHLALFVEDHTPLLFYSSIADFAIKHLKAGGTLYFEINQYLAHETSDLLFKKGFRDVSILNDINQAARIIMAKI